MELTRITVGDDVVAEVVGDSVSVASAGDAVELFLNAGIDAVILREGQLAPEFYRLTGGAG